METQPHSQRVASIAFQRMSPAARLKSIIGDANRLSQANRTALVDSNVQNKVDGKRVRWSKVRRYSRMFSQTQLKSPSRKPKLHFRSISRFIILLIRTCRACKDLLTYNVKREQWHGLVDNVVAEEDLPKKRKTRPFVTLSFNDKREIVKLTFDVADFNKDAKSVVTEKALESLRKMPIGRSADDVNTIMLCLKAASVEFSTYPLDIQRAICQHGIFDSFFDVIHGVDLKYWYRHNRVLIRHGKPAHGMYILIRGHVVEKRRGERSRVSEISAGEIFGYQDIILGLHRNSTLVTKTSSDIFFLHKLDYKRIFEMTPNSCDSLTLDICRRHVVFQHFPMQYIINNPGVWSTWRYKHGRLIVPDSNDTDWIYVIKSGEARVIKRLSPGTVDVKSRRKRIQAILDRECPYERTKKLLNFIAEREYTKSGYRREVYHPGLRQFSAPAGGCRKSRTTSALHRSLPAPSTSQTYSQRRHNRIGTSRSETFGEQPLPSGRSDFISTTKLPYISTPTEPMQEPEDRDFAHHQLSQASKANSGKVPGSRCSAVAIRKQTKSAEVSPHGVLPPFVHLESLHPGDAFGFRSCLDPEDRGPSASLVSAECEVIKINKRFFMKHADDAVFSLIRLKAKPFPTQEELVDRLDANTQWAQYKDNVINDFVRHLHLRR